MTNELAIQLKDARYTNAKFWYGGDNEPSSDKVPYPDSGELISAIMKEVNELAIGYNDSGSFWHFQYGPRGAGNMIEGIGEKFSALDADSLDEAAALLWLKIKSEQKYSQS